MRVEHFAAVDRERKEKEMVTEKIDVRRNTKSFNGGERRMCVHIYIERERGAEMGL